MKMTTTHLEKLALAVHPFDTQWRREAYRNRDTRIPNIDKVKDLDRRYRWDLFYAAAGQDRTLYADLGSYNDSHIETALRRVVPSLTCDVTCTTDCGYCKGEQA